VSAAPDYLEPVVGWRSWLLEAPGGEVVLRSVVRATRWPAAEPLVAECGRSPVAHPAPWARCSCGIHATRTPDEPIAHLEVPSRSGLPQAIGRVLLWGDVVEGERGWRASHAAPELLYLPMRGAAERERLEAFAWDLSRYGAPVVILDATATSLREALAVVDSLEALPVPGAI
jgi:hypothetical protein